MFRSDVKTVYINSDNRTAGTAEDFTITNIPSFNNNPISVKLINACVPMTWYNVVAGSNTLTFVDSAASLWTITLPPGNYDGTTAAAALQTLMNAAGAVDSYTVAYDGTNYKLTFTSTGNLTLDFTVAPNLAKFLGFVSGDVYGPALSITSPNMVNMLLTTEIFICSDLVFGTDNGVIPWTSSIPNYGVLARIPLLACFGKIIVYTATGELPFYSIVQSEFSELQDPNNNIPRTMRFYLLFPDGTPINLNGFNWSAELLFNFND